MALKKRIANLTVFSIGAFGYGLIEVLWRGYTHWSMLTAVGLSLLGLCRIERGMKTNLLKKAFAGCALITGIELIFGIIFNIILKKRVWSYKEIPLNLGGQICARYSFFWLILSIILMPLASGLNHKMQSD